RSYSPFGQRQAEAGTQPALGFQHQYTDPDSGNVNMGARWYQPGTATFASRDTAGLDPRDLSNSNRYAYASADPLANTDPSGYLVVAPVVPIVAVIARSAAVRQVGTRLITRGAAIVGGIVGDWASDLFTTKKIRGIPSPAPQSVPIPQIAWSIWQSLEISRIALLAGFNFPHPSGSRPSGSGGFIGGVGGPLGGFGPASPGAWNTVDLQRLRTFLEQLRRQRLEDLVNTPHARPPQTRTVVDSIQEAIDAAKRTVIDLGVIQPEGGEPAPYEPETNHGIDQPAPLPPATAHLNDSCADGARPKTDGSRSAQIWRCGSDGGAREGSTSTSKGEQLTRVGRWMSRGEYDAMRHTGQVQEGAGGTTYVAHPGDPNAFGREAKPGSIYVEFDVPHSSLYPAGKPGWAQIPGPNSMYGRLAKKRGQDPLKFPAALNVELVKEKW
uniref:RHS repeat-associated core domain-containing protein n=1 Tax=Saccharomonospora sp. NB11 TaxID=1642298 RepID=UPI002106034F